MSSACALASVVCPPSPAGANLRGATATSAANRPPPISPQAPLNLAPRSASLAARPKPSLGWNLFGTQRTRLRALEPLAQALHVLGVPARQHAQRVALLPLHAANRALIAEPHPAVGPRLAQAQRPQRPHRIRARPSRHLTKRLAQAHERLVRVLRRGDGALALVVALALVGEQRRARRPERRAQRLIILLLLQPNREGDGLGVVIRGGD
mmetsp:Transcript_51371/g.170224  ORF Transcript_51371/g.170224 Transcript_51371/m.170224 type:complete len:210 (+) Transcript_51371:146-775(+)